MNKNTKKLTVVTGAALATVAVNAQNVHADAQVVAKSNATVEESPVQKQHEQALQNVKDAQAKDDQAGQQVKSAQGNVDQAQANVNNAQKAADDANAAVKNAENDVKNTTPEGF